MNYKALSIALISAAATASVWTAFADDEKPNPIADAMKYAHKAPKGEKKVSDRIIDGTATDEELKKTLALYKAMANTEPPKGDPAAFKVKVAKLITATEDVVAKKDGAPAAYKEAVDCKSCHTDFRPKKQ